MNVEPEFMRVNEAAALLSVSRTTAYELARAGVIPTVRIGQSIRIPRRRLLEWLDARTTGGVHPVDTGKPSGGF